MVFNQMGQAQPTMGQSQMSLLNWVKEKEQGFQINGPIGTVALAVFGQQVNPHLQQGFGSTRMYLDTSHLPMGEKELTFFITAFSMLAKLADADGDISSTEKRTIGRFIQDGLKLDQDKSELALTIFRVARNVDFTFEDFAKQFKEINKRKPAMLESFMDVLLALAAADQVFSAEERKLLTVARDVFEISEARFEQLKQRHLQDANTPYHVLGCSPNDPLDVVKKNYLKLSKQWHPDRAVKEGMPAEFSAVAKQKYEQIEAAYAAIQSESGDS